MNLMREVNWLTVRELVRYHTVICAWKFIKCGTLHHMKNKIVILPGHLLCTISSRLQNMALGLRWQMVEGWNKLPQELKDLNSLPLFKVKTKRWIKSLRGMDLIDKSENVSENDDTEDESLRLDLDLSATSDFPPQIRPLAPPGPPPDFLLPPDPPDLRQLEDI